MVPRTRKIVNAMASVIMVSAIAFSVLPMMRFLVGDDSVQSVKADDNKLVLDARKGMDFLPGTTWYWSADRSEIHVTGDLTISGEWTGVQIVAERATDNEKYTLTLSDLYINNSNNFTDSALKIMSGADMHVQVPRNDRVILSGGSTTPTIEVPENNTFTFDGEGTLDITSRHYYTADGCAAIGDQAREKTGTIIVNSGVLNVKGGEKGAAINAADDNQVIINGGIIHATGGDEAAGIGGSQSDGKFFLFGNNRSKPGGTVTINGGIVYATGGMNSAGIGGGHGGNGSRVVINGGFVRAIGGTNATDIGGGTGSENDGTIVNRNGDKLKRYNIHTEMPNAHIQAIKMNNIVQGLPTYPSYTWR